MSSELFVHISKACSRGSFTVSQEVAIPGWGSLSRIKAPDARASTENKILSIQAEN